LASEAIFKAASNCFCYCIAQYHANVAHAEEEQSFYVTIDSKEKSQFHTSVLIFLAQRSPLSGPDSINPKEDRMCPSD
jgi:hypothetical protein